MRILQIAPPWFPVPPDGYGGIELVVAGLTNGLVATGHQVTLLASGGSVTPAELRTVYARPPAESLGDVAVELPHVLAGYLRRAGFDVIHDHTMVGAAMGALLARPPVLHTVHGEWTPAARHLYRQIAERIHLVAISHDHASRARDVPLAGVVHNGIEVDRYPFRSETEGYLAFLGRAGPDKGADLAVTVARRLRRPLRMGLKINEPAEHAWFGDVLAPLLVDADVTVIRNATHRQKVTLLGGADAVLFPIRWDEPFGLVMVEANACGTPVVAFARGAVPEVLEDGRTGLLVESGDVDGMCAATERIVSLDRAACRDHVERRFTAARMVAGYVRIYERLTTRPSAPAIAADALTASH